MKIIIHFGHHKVGTTALQAYLAQNALALLRQGILYPAVETQGMSHLLAQAMGLHRKADVQCMNLREPHNALAFRMLAGKTGAQIPTWHAPLPGLPAMTYSLRHQVEVLKPHTLILCSEVFANFGSHGQDLVEALKKIFPDAEYELYCVLRRPDEYATSWYGQRLRFGHKLGQLADPRGLNLKAIHFDYKKMIAPWVEAFPGSPLHLRNYDDILKAGGSVQDFTTCVSCSFPRYAKKDKQANVGLPRAAYELLRRGNHDLPEAEARVLRELFLGKVLPVSVPANHEIEVFGAEQRARLVEAFAPIHAYLNTLSSREAFFPDIDNMANPRPIPLIDATRKLLDDLTPVVLPDAALRDYINGLKQTF